MKVSTARIICPVAAPASEAPPVVPVAIFRNSRIIRSLILKFVKSLDILYAKKEKGQHLASLSNEM
jgi:hypothetical protein